MFFFKSDITGHQQKLIIRTEISVQISLQDLHIKTWRL